MNASRFIFAVIFLALVPIGYADSIVQIGMLTLTLPDGYRHERKQGIDTTVGRIEVASATLEISYDVGALAYRWEPLSQMPKSKLESLCYYETMTLSGMECRFEGYRSGKDQKGLVLAFRIHEAFANFFVLLTDASMLPTAKEVFLRMKFAASK